MKVHGLKIDESKMYGFKSICGKDREFIKTSLLVKEVDCKSCLKKLKP